jgi:hypothetical protein
MLWVINSLIYGFFTAVYTLFNQHYKMNGYILGIWRGFGISLLFMPFLFFFEIPENVYYWCLLLLQGYLIGIYDSHLFFASAKYGAGPTSRFMAITVLITTFFWWLLTPEKFIHLVEQGNIFITLILVLFGFTFCYWQMIRTHISKRVARYVLPAVLSLAGMSIITKYIALDGASVWQAIVYYLTVSTFISGCYNLYRYIKSAKSKSLTFLIHNIFSFKMLKAGIYLIVFSAVLITAKTMALRVAPNPGYVTALLLIAPIFIFTLNRYYKIPDNVSVRAGFAMIFFLLLLVLLVNGNYGIND